MFKLKRHKNYLKKKVEDTPDPTPKYFELIRNRAVEKLRKKRNDENEKRV